MEIEILSGRFNTADTVAARGNFNGWGRHDLVPSTLDPNLYVSEVPYADTLRMLVIPLHSINFSIHLIPGKVAIINFMY